MKKYLFSALTALSMIFCSCGDKELPQNAHDAEIQGRADAEALSRANYTADRELHAALLAVKSREFEMRQNGDTLGAIAYITAFKEQLKEIDHTLASKVL